MNCPHCGREMSSINDRPLRCTNVQCPSIKWRSSRSDHTNVVELTPIIERDRTTSGREFLGTVYVKEVRIVDGCPCQGVSLSTVATGQDMQEVRLKTLTEAKNRAHAYEQRGYDVRLKKVAA